MPGARPGMPLASCNPPNTAAALIAFVCLSQIKAEGQRCPLSTEVACVAHTALPGTLLYSALMLCMLMARCWEGNYK